MKYALTSILTRTHQNYDPALLPDKKDSPGLANHVEQRQLPDAKNVDSATMQQNSMRILENSHRTNFLSFVKASRHPTEPRRT